MAASSGVFEDETIGKKQPPPPGRTTVVEPSADADDEDATEKQGGVSKALGALKGMFGGGESAEFTTLAPADFKPAKKSVNWFAVLFLLVCIIILLTSQY